MGNKVCPKREIRDDDDADADDENDVESRYVKKKTNTRAWADADDDDDEGSTGMEEEEEAVEKEKNDWDDGQPDPTPPPVAPAPVLETPLRKDDDNPNNLIVEDFDPNTNDCRRAFVFGLPPLGFPEPLNRMVRRRRHPVAAKAASDPAVPMGFD